jgi:acetolactate synthase-1/2/3 large subunit
MGDAKAAVLKLSAAVDAGETRLANDVWLRRAQTLVSAWRDEIEPLRQSDAIPIRPERLCKEVSDCLPENAVLVADTGYSAIWTATMVQLKHPDQRYIRAAGSLGWAFPAALGAKCALPDRPVICFTGDGGFWYHLSELETARRYQINTITIINNNGGLAQGIPDVHAMYGDRPGNPEELYRFEPVSFARIAAEMGCLGVRIEEPGEIAGAIRQALAQQGLSAGRPAVIEVMTGLHYRAPEPWSPVG